MPTVSSSATDASFRVFISYSHRGAQDQRLAHIISERLSAEGHSIFIDRKITVGQDWAAEIAAEIAKADFLIVLLSESSCRSEMVKGEIELARSQGAIRNGSPRILPVRVSFAGGLPYPLNAYLDKIQYLIWRGDSDSDRLLSDLQAAIAGQSIATPNPSKMSPTTFTRLPPAYEAGIAPATGALENDDPFYIVRDTDNRALNVIRQTGQTIIIKGPRQIGKSSLLVRVVSQAEVSGKDIVVIDLQLFGHAERSDSRLFFRRFASAVADQLQATAGLDKHWDSDSSDLQKCTRFIEGNVLNRSDKPLTLAIDEVDIIFGTPFRQDFFGMIRSWHNTRAYPTKRVWKKLDLVLVSSTEPYMFIDRPHESPFNVGEILNIEDFSFEDIKELNVRHGQCLYLPEIEKLATLLDGHPYLTRRAFYLLSQSSPLVTPDELFRAAISESGPFGDHLRYYLLRLQEQPDLAHAFVEILHGGNHVDEGQIYRLAGAGLVRRRGKKIVPRCSLYADFFLERLPSRV